MTATEHLFDRHLLCWRRKRAFKASNSTGSDERPCDFLLGEIADDFVLRLSAINRHFERAVELGAHTGLLGRRISDLGRITTLVQTEFVTGLAETFRGAAIVCDEELPPFAPASLDLVVSALVLQWVNDLPGTLIQIRRALRPDGLFLGALLGGETLGELRTALLAAEAELRAGASPRVAPFADVRSLGGLLQRAGFALPVADRDVLRVHYETPLALMRDLRAMGATNVLTGRSRQCLRRDVLARACKIYVERFCTDDGRVPATFEIVTLTGWAPDDSQPKPLRPGSAKTRLADALGAVTKAKQSRGDR